MTFRGYLPHFVTPGRRQFVTFALADALPRDVVERRANAAADAAARGEIDDGRAAFAAAQRALDAGAGSCLLREAHLAREVESALRRRHGVDYALLAWVVMPNHVHAAIALAPGARVGAVVQAWKSVAAHSANRALNRRGRFWRPEYFDVLIRDDDHLSRVRNYIERNPVAARLCARPDDWPFGSAGGRAPAEA
jgi:REP element-mobilizing transposase RayT